MVLVSLPVAYVLSLLTLQTVRVAAGILAHVRAHKEVGGLDFRGSLHPTRNVAVGLLV